MEVKETILLVTQFYSFLSYFSFDSIKILYFLLTFKSKFSSSKSPHSVFAFKFWYCVASKSSDQNFMSIFQTPIINFQFCWEDKRIPNLFNAFSTRQIQLSMSQGQLSSKQQDIIQLKDTPLWLQFWSMLLQEHNQFLETSIFSIEGMFIAEQTIYFYETMLRALISLFLLSSLLFLDSLFKAFLTFSTIYPFLICVQFPMSDVEKLISLFSLFLYLIILLLILDCRTDCVSFFLLPICKDYICSVMQDFKQVLKNDKLIFAYNSVQSNYLNLLQYSCIIKKNKQQKINKKQQSGQPNIIYIWVTYLQIIYKRGTKQQIKDYFIYHMNEY